MGEVPPYLVLLRVGFALPAALLPRRCALTAPFHPYLNPPFAKNAKDGPPNFRYKSEMWAGRYVFCGTCRPPGLNLTSRTLSGTLLCGVRTFLPAGSASLQSLIWDLPNRRGDRPAQLPTRRLYARDRRYRTVQTISADGPERHGIHFAFAFLLLPRSCTISATW
jgi:hypothetical protein